MRDPTISMSGKMTWVVRLADRLDPFNPGQKLRTWVGDGHTVAWGSLAWVFVFRAEAETVAARFGGEATVMEAWGLMTGTRLCELAGHVMAGRPQWADTIRDGDMDTFLDMQRDWLRALRIKDGRCNVSGTDGEAVWRLRRETPEWFIASLDDH